MFELIDYENRYKSEIDDLQNEVWGNGSDSDEIIKSLNNRRVKVVLKNEKVIGVSVCEINRDMCHIDFIIIKPEFQKKGLGTIFMEDIIEYCKNNKVRVIECEAIDVYGKVNSEKLLIKYDFVCDYNKDKYWGELYPDFYCKQCGCRPCVCSMKKYIKQL